MKRILLALGFLTVAAFTSVAAEMKLTGENTKIEFTGTKPQGKHTGGFKKLMGTASAEGGDLSKLKIDIDIEVDSLYSDDEKLTGHLKNADFFNVKEYPKAKFVASKVTKTDKGYEVVGELTMLGKKQEVKMNADITMDAGTLKLKSEFKIDRTKWGMNYGKGKIDDEVALKVTLEAK
jgi:polyisoprenoid-binding protein YceI